MGVKGERVRGRASPDIHSHTQRTCVTDREKEAERMRKKARGRTDLSF